MTYEESLARANVQGALSSAAVTGTLWAIGISWSNAIRGISLAIFPVDQVDIIFGELVAAVATTVIGVAVAFTVVRSCRSCERCAKATLAPAAEAAPPPRAASLPSRPAVRYHVGGGAAPEGSR